MEISDHLSDEMMNIVEARPYLRTVLTQYIPQIKDTLDKENIDYKLRIVVKMEDGDPKKGWYPLMKIITKENLKESKRRELAITIRNTLDEELQKLKESDYNDDIIESESDQLRYGIGTEEEFNDRDNKDTG